MAYYVVSDSTLANIANIIREKTGLSAPIEFPNGFVNAIESISTDDENNFVITIIMDENEMYVPDCSYDEIIDAYYAGKNICVVGYQEIFDLNNDGVIGFFDEETQSLIYTVTHNITDLNSRWKETLHYTLTADGLTVDPNEDIYYDAEDANALPNDVANGKIFYNSNGRAIGTHTNTSGPASVAAKEVNFRDYDGTVVYSYTPAEFAALSAMPANPDHSGDAIPLTSQGWNWSLADAQAYVAKYGRLEVGQMYVTTDGKTHIKIYIDPNTPANRMTFYLRWTQSVSNGVTVDWGDGSATQTYSGTEAATHDHTYAAGGWYDITLDVTAGNISFAGEMNYCIFGTYNNNDKYMYNRIRNVRLGNGLSAEALDGYTFYYCQWLTDITMPNGIVSLGDYMFDLCYRLTSVTVPSSVRMLKNGVFSSSHIYSASLPKGITELPRTFYQAYYLKYVSIPDTVISYEYTFRGCYSLEFLTSPESVQTIGSNSFLQCGIGEYHFTSATPPVLSTTTNYIFGNGYDNFIIYVPRGSLSAYQSATNWSAIAPNIREEPQ